MEPKPRSAFGVVFVALLVVVILWLIVRIVEAIWVPLVIILLIVLGLAVVGWLLYRRLRRW